MTVRGGRELLASPGPTNIPDEVLQAMHRPAVEIYSKPLIALTDSLLRDLGRVFRTAGRSYIYIANGHGAWEAALTNVLSKGDKVLVLESGKFALDWGDAAARLGVEVEVVPGDWRHAIGPEEIERRLRADKGNTIKAILAVHIDTSSSLLTDIAGIGQAIKSARHNALLMVDSVASLGCVPFEMDAWGVDVAMSGSQKGLMAPPGLSFVAANERARDVHRKAGLRTPYWDWTARDGDAHYVKIRRHAAHADDVCDASGPRHAVCRRARERSPSPSAAGAGGSQRHRGVEQAQDHRLLHRRAGRALRCGDDRAHGRLRIPRRFGITATPNAA